MTLPPDVAQPPLAQTLRWLLRPVAFLEECRRRYGDAFGVTFLGFQTPMVMLSDPAAIRALYSEREHGLPPGRTFALRPVLGDRSLLLLEGAEHLARRKLMLPPFHGERMRAYEDVMRDETERAMSSWPRQTAFAIHPHMQSITLEVIMRAVFGVTDEARRERLRGMLQGLLSATASPGLQLRALLARRLGGPDPLERLRASLKPLDDLLAAEIAQHREGSGDGSILSLLVAARFEDGAPMSDSEIRDQLLTLLLAGHETTATGLAWTFDMLLRHPGELARLTDEVREGGADDYLRAVVAESLRLRPVVPLAGRRLATELRADGYVLPPGTDVTPAIWLTHTRADVYPDPYAFRPERFLDAAPQTYAWIPFGGGVRRCIGAAFAEFEMRVVLETVLRSRTLRAADPAPDGIARRNVTWSPRRGTPVVVTG